MIAPNRPSRLRSFSNNKFRLAFLVGVVVITATMFSSMNSVASSLSQRLFASATAVINGGQVTTAANHALEFAAAPQGQSSTMSSARRGHTATRLSDGRVLIAGGENGSGVLNESEIYDPASSTFSSAANMTVARVDHTATLLGDGRVLIAGGRDGAGAVATTEIFDPATGAFSSGPSLSVARAGHSATLFANGTLLVAGGTASGSAELLNVGAGTSSAAGTMSVARSMHSAALLQDGRVLIVGGRDASGNELLSGEIYDPAGSFTAVNNTMKVSRVRAHTHVLFDGKVQIIGGTNDGSMEIYDPAFPGFGAYAHVLPESDPCVGLEGQIRSSRVRAALFRTGHSDSLLDRAGHTITELNGQALVLGGANGAGNVLSSSSVVGSSSASITTDKMDYSPGETAYISGRGFQAGETVRIKIHEDPHTPQERGFDVVAGADGNFTGEYLVANNDENMKFIVGARGLASGVTAQTTFTDSNNFNVTPLTQTVTGGSTNTFVWTFTAQNAGNQQTTTFTIPAGWTAPQVGPGAGQVSVAGSGGSPCNVSLQSVVGMVVTIRQSPPSPATGTCANNTSFTLTYSNATAPNPAVTTTYTFDNQHGQDPQVTVTAAVVATSLTLAVPSPASVAFGSTGPVTFSATLTRTSGGAPVSGATISFTVDGSPISPGTAVTNASGVATLTYDPAALSVGPHTVQASFAGQTISGTTYSGSTSGTQTLTVNKRDTLTNVSSSLNPSTFGENVTFTATVVGTGAGAGNPSGGSVQFKIDGANFGAPVALVAGSASTSTSSLTAGNHTVEALFTSADTNFNDSSDSLDGGQTVNKRDTLTTVSSSLNPSTFGENVTFTATVVGTGAGAGNPAGGSVQFKIDGANFGAPVALVAGSATTSTSSLTAGNHTVEALFTSADTNFNDSSDSLDGGQTVNKRDTLTTVSSSLNPSTFGENVTFTATVVGTGAGAGNPAGGSVQFKIDGANFGAPVALVAGSATTSTSSLTAGNHTVEAFFTSTDANFNDSSDSLDGGQTVNKRDTLTTVSSSLNPSTFGENVTFTATVVGTGAGAGNPSGGSVQFKIDGANFGAPVAFSGGSASSTAISSLTAGNHTVEALFTSADTNFNDSSDSLDGGQTVNKRDTLTTVSSSLNPSTFGENVTFTATVVGTGAGAGNPSGGSVQFKIDGANFGAPVALVAGSASTSTSSLTAGNHTVEAFFTSADANFNDSSDSLDGGQTVNKRDTLTTVSSSLNPSTFGENVTFTATVVGTGAGAGNPSGGSVQFKIDGANFGAPVALVAGSATTSTSSLTAGNHTVEALFTSTDTNFNDSNDSLDGGQTVNKRDTLTTVSSSLNPSTFGENVTFTATVVGTGAGAGNPSGGSVQFKIDGANFGAPVALSGGSASSTAISSLTAGNHTVEALFTSTDTNFNDSNDSLDGGQTVNKRDTLTTISSSLNPSTFGESVTFTATVVGTGAGAGNPSGGSVQFKIDGANFGAPVALSGGSASSTAISSLTAGNHTVEAVFTSADTNFNDSSDLLDGGQTVNKRDTLTTVSSSLNPSIYGQTVTFTATVAGTGPGAGNPSGGSVQFKIDGANVGAPIALSGGSASSGGINSLGAGTHTVETVFTSADTNFNNSSDLLDGGQVVNKAPLTITASSHTVTFNDPVPTITASYSGFVLGDDATDLTTQPACSTTYTVGSLVGTYPTKCENAASSNYSFTYINGTVTVLTACSVFNGFLSPIGGAIEKGTGGSFTDPVRAFKLGSTVPVKFNAICFGVPLTTGIHTMQVTKFSNSTDSDPPIDATPTDAATTGNQFRLTGTEWHYNLNTKALGNGASSSSISS